MLENPVESKHKHLQTLSFYLNEFSVLLPQLCKQVWVCVHICVFAECCLHLQAWLIRLILRGVGVTYVLPLAWEQGVCVCVRALVLHFHHTCRFFVWPEVCALLVRLMFVFQLNFLTTCADFVSVCAETHGKQWWCAFMCGCGESGGSARNPLLSAAGASWHRQGTRCQNLLGGPVTLFLISSWKTGSGHPGINPLKEETQPQSPTGPNISNRWINNKKMMVKRDQENISVVTTAFYKRLDLNNIYGVFLYLWKSFH